MSTSSQRKTSVPIEAQFTERWSPRSFRAEPLRPEQVSALFEAARWAPSCFNEQPWRFVYATEAEDRERLAALLVEGNRVWAAKAPLLGIVFAKKSFTQNGKPNRWGPFDAGAACLSLALQARASGLYAHFMGGFDEPASYAALGVPEQEYTAMAAFAVGHRGEASALPEELAEREQPSDRKPLGELAFEGRFRSV